MPNNQSSINHGIDVLAKTPKDRHILVEAIAFGIRWGIALAGLVFSLYYINNFLIK